MMGSNNQISVRRLLAEDGKETYVDVPFFIVDEPCYIEPIDAQVTAIIDGLQAFKSFKIFCEGKLDIQEGDQCVDANGRTFSVKGVEPFSDNPDTGDMTQLIAVLIYQHAKN